MVNGEVSDTKIKTDNKGNNDIGFENLLEHSMDGGADSAAFFTAHALQKSKARERREQGKRHSELDMPYRKQRRKIEQKLGHVGTSMLDARDKITDRQAIEQEIRDYGVGSEDELGDLDYDSEGILSPNQIFQKYRGLFEFLGEDTKQGNPNLLEEYGQITDKKKQLEFILSSSLPDKVRLFCSGFFGYPNYDNFMKKLEFQQGFIDGEIGASVRKWDPRIGDHIEVWEPLNSSGTYPENIALGLKRGALYSAMIGSPELASVKIATAKVNEGRSEGNTVREIVCLHGFGSGIDEWGNGNIGQWADLCDEYKIAFDKMNQEHNDESSEQKEHRAVRELANWLTGAFEYNGQIRVSGSPYDASLKEAVVAGRLSYNARRQFGGMRRKLGSDLHNIGRFVGKSGDSRKSKSLKSEWQELEYDSHREMLDDDERQYCLQRENASEIKKQEERREKEIARINHKYEKLIGKTRSEERRVTYASRQEEEIQRVITETSELIAYFESRSFDDYMSDIIERQEVVSRKIEKRKSLAEKAIDLHFILNVGEKDDGGNRIASKYAGVIDWINDAPFGVIKRAHRRINDGMSADEVYKLAIMEIISQPKDEVRSEGVKLGGVYEYCISGAREEFPEWGAEEILRFTDKAIDFWRLTGLTRDKMIERVRTGELDLDVIDEYPWLIRQYSNESCGEADVFPAKKSDNAKYKWCSDNSFVWLDGDWGRQTLGKIIFTRLQAGVDESVHDATQWLSAFQIPEMAYDIPGIKKRVEMGEGNIDIEEFSMRLYDKNEEKRFLVRILSAPQSIRSRLNLSSKEQNMSRMFSVPEHIFVYSELIKVIKNPEIDIEEFRETIRTKMKDYYDNNIVNSDGKSSGWRMPFDEFKGKVIESLGGILRIVKSGDKDDERMGEIAQRLNQYGINRRAYIDDATSWLVKHTVSPQASLTKAWANRASAIAEGVSDSAAEINNWANSNSLVKGEERYLAENGIYIHDLETTYAPFVKELTRCYGAKTSARALVDYKNIHNPEKILPASTIPVEVGGRKFTGEVLAHDDPRGMTIGFDTGCCMTVDGVSESCIESGYRDSGAGFFAFYDENGRINAQSYFFTDPTHPEVVVMDNIEANSGRNSDRIIEVYQEFFREYLKERFATDPNWQIRQVNVGTRYGEVAKAQVLRLEETEIVPNNLSSYSDARGDQRVLIRLSDEEIDEARKGNQAIESGNSVEPNHSPTSFVSPLGINQLPILQSLESQLYPDIMRQYDDNDFAYQELTMPGVDRYSFLIKVQEDAVSEASGYCLAYEDSSKTDPNYQGKVVYVADFGIRPGARGGMTALKAFDELLRRIDEDGIERIEMDTRESTSYRFFTSEWGRRYLTRRGYDVMIHDETESFGNGEKTRLISLEKKLG